MEHHNANVAVYIIEGLIVFFILFKIFQARGGRELFIRRISALNSLDEAVGRATEMGRPMLFNPGIGGLSIVSLQALAILSHVVKKAAQYGTRIIIPTRDAMLYTIAEEMTRDAYAEAGAEELFEKDDVRYLSDNQFAFASALIGLIYREQVATALYFGEYAGESLILTENGQAAGAVQITGTPMTTQIPFFIATCDYTIIGDEYYAASAYISREPTLLGSLVGQDFGKLVILLVIVLGIISYTIAAFFPDIMIVNKFNNTFIGYFR